MNVAMPPPKNATRLIADNLKELRFLRDRTVELFKKYYPPGADVWWRSRGATQTGYVVDHGFDGRVKVHNAHTGREYWTDIERLVL